MPAFSSAVKGLLGEYLPGEEWRIVSERDYGDDAILEVFLGDLRIKFVAERGVAFWMEVANHEQGSKFCSARALVLLATGAPIERSRVMASHEIAQLGPIFGELLSSRANVAKLLEPERLAETQERLKAIGTQTLHPVIERALKERR